MNNPFASSEFKKVSNPFAGRRCPPTGIFTKEFSDPYLVDVFELFNDVRDRFFMVPEDLLKENVSAAEAFKNEKPTTASTPGGWKDSGSKVFANWESMGFGIASVPDLAGLAGKETDPNGFAPNTPGAKLDAGKLLPHLVLSDFANALWEVVKVGTYGATGKYTPSGWLKVPGGKERYAEARERHWFDEVLKGEVDDESGIYHAAHRIWNDLAVLELKIRERKHVNG